MANSMFGTYSVPMIKLVFEKWFWISLFWGWFTLTIGLSGMVEEMVVFIDSVEPMMRRYLDARRAVVEMIPFIKVPPQVLDYLVIASGYIVAYKIWLAWCEVHYADDYEAEDAKLPFYHFLMYGLVWPFLFVYDFFRNTKSWEGSVKKDNGEIWTPEDTKEAQLETRMRLAFTFGIFAAAVTVLYLITRRAADI